MPGKPRNFRKMGQLWEPKAVAMYGDLSWVVSASAIDWPELAEDAGHVILWAPAEEKVHDRAHAI